MDEVLGTDEPAGGVVQAPTAVGSRDEVLQVLGGRRRPWRSRLLRFTLLVAVLAAGVGLAAPRWANGSTPRAWETATVERADVTVVVRATGNLEPQRTVEVGAEISGRIEAVAVEVNDEVVAGQVLARFETDVLENQLAQAEATLASATADVLCAEANELEANTQLQRTRTLVARGVSSSYELDTAEAASKRARAETARASAQKQLAGTRLELTRTQLTKAVIRTTIDGVVLTRTVEPGNTIQASFQAPELFSIAEDLGQMELHVSIDEADVGRVRAGQPATFTVDAWPEREFSASVTKVHLAPTSTDNVITYVAELEVDNAEGLLRPGMTAAVTIVTGQRLDVLTLPNAAFRFTPPEEASGGFQLAPGPPGGGSTKQHASGSSVWVPRQDALTRITLATGATDGTRTEITGDTLAEGAEVVIGSQRGAQ